MAKDRYKKSPPPEGDKKPDGAPVEGEKQKSAGEKRYGKKG